MGNLKAKLGPRMTVGKGGAKMGSSGPEPFTDSDSLTSVKIVAAETPKSYQVQNSFCPRFFLDSFTQSVALVSRACSHPLDATVAPLCPVHCVRIIASWLHSLFVSSCGTSVDLVVGV